MCLALAPAAHAEAKLDPKKIHPVKLTKTELRTVKSAVLEKLKDPDSAKFGHINANRDQSSGLVNVCGWVNAKNGFGGYVGMSPFYGMYVPPTKRAVILQIATDDVTDNVVHQMCLDSYVPLSKGDYSN